MPKSKKNKLANHERIALALAEAGTLAGLEFDADNGVLSSSLPVKKKQKNLKRCEEVRDKECNSATAEKLLLCTGYSFEPCNEHTKEAESPRKGKKHFPPCPDCGAPLPTHYLRRDDFSMNMVCPSGAAMSPKKAVSLLLESIQAARIAIYVYEASQWCSIILHTSLSLLMEYKTPLLKAVQSTGNNGLSVSLSHHEHCLQY